MSDISLQLIEQVNTALVDNTKLNIIGGNSKSFMGRVLEPSKAVEDINIRQHRGIVNYQPDELVLTARAGTTISEINSALAEHKQSLSFEPPDFNGRATLGGTLACHLSGPSRPWAGSVRDMVLGTRLINGKGEHLRFGGQVIKNVAGYDVSRLQAGAMGTLGIITEVSLKVLPKPKSSLTLVEEMDAPQAIQRMNQLAGTPKPLNAACWHNNKLYLRLSGTQSGVKNTAQIWPGKQLENANNFWVDLREQRLEFFTNDKPLWRLSVKPSAEPVLEKQDWLLDWCGAQRWLSTDSIDKQTLQQTAVQMSGQANLFRGGDRSSEVFHEQVDALRAISLRVKSAFDPQQIFNIGRLYSWM